MAPIVRIRRRFVDLAVSALTTVNANTFRSQTLSSANTRQILPHQTLKVISSFGQITANTAADVGFITVTEAVLLAYIAGGNPLVASNIIFYAPFWMQPMAASSPIDNTIGFEFGAAGSPQKPLFELTPDDMNAGGASGGTPSPPVTQYEFALQFLVVNSDSVSHNFVYQFYTDWIIEG